MGTRRYILENKKVLYQKKVIFNVFELVEIDRDSDRGSGPSLLGSDMHMIQGSIWKLLVFVTP